MIGYLTLSASACAAARTSGDASTGSGSGGDTSTASSAQVTSSGEGGSGGQSSTTTGGQGGAAATTGAGGNSTTTSSSTTTTGQGSTGATTSSSSSSSSSTGTGGTTLSGGAVVWSRAYGDTSDCSLQRVAVDPSGNVVISTSSNFDQGFQVDYGGGVLAGNFFLVKLSPAGGHLWSKGWSSPRGIEGLAVDATGHILITGLMRKPLDFGTGALATFDGWDGFIARLDPQGNGLWARAVSDSNQQSNSQWGLAIAADAAGNVFTAGRLDGAIDLGDGELLAEKGFSSGQDVYLARFTP